MIKKQNWYTNPYKYHFIYKTTCLITNKYYYGMHSTDDLFDGYIGSGTYLAKAIRKYGRENFKMEILEHFSDRESLRKRESEIISKEMLKDSQCMNLIPGGCGVYTRKLSMSKGFSGKKHHEVSRKKISKSLKRRWSSLTERERMINAQRNHKKTDETKKKISDANKGKVLSDEHRKKIAESVKLAHAKRKFEIENQSELFTD